MKIPEHRQAFTILGSCQTAQGNDITTGFRAVADEILYLAAPAFMP